MTDNQPAGLFGHPFSNTLRAAVGEFVGTFILVLAITATAVAAALAKPVAGPAYSSAAIPMAGALALAAVIAGFGHVTGAHVNPAVTIALAVRNRFPWRAVPAYLIAQFLGSIVAALIVWIMYGDRGRDRALLGAPVPAVGALRTLGIEAVMTFILVCVVYAVATDPRVSRASAAVCIGFALGVCIYISGPATGAGVNPARALGPMLVAGQWTSWWAYLVGPVVGGFVAVCLYDFVLRPTHPILESPAPSPGLVVGR
ncbi:aquaporin [Actinoplanes sp. TBRC 11911]|uniref:MIP/aquaporin family protein n=1 Tax=Actinoplanes sp. TBRC 11911 TaxID=2729386 RepID=UPI00145ED0A5|nr:aquaporin [Actinoplanes sp. TBRC 11911]NMO50097.1 aquaporin [Actinoplanes sp. TBRC 11911]